MTVQELMRKPIVSLSDGEKVGEVQDVLISTGDLTASALVLGSPQGKGFLPFADLRNVGKDAITVESSQVIQWATERTTDGLRLFSELKDLSVVNSEGTALGPIHDIELTENWAIKALEFKSGGVFGVGAHHRTVAAAEIRKIGPKVITVEHVPKA